MYDYMTYLYYIYMYVCIYIFVYIHISFFRRIAQSQSPPQLLHQIYSDMIPRTAQCHSTELLTSEGMDSELLITSSGRANLFLLLSILLSLLLLFHLSLFLSLPFSSASKKSHFAYVDHFFFILNSCIISSWGSKVWYLKWAPVNVTDVAPGTKTGSAASSQ